MPEVEIFHIHDETITYLPFTSEGLDRLFQAFDTAYLFEPCGTTQEAFLRAGLDALRKLCNP